LLLIESYKRTANIKLVVMFVFILLNYIFSVQDSGSSFFFQLIDASKIFYADDASVLVEVDDDVFGKLFADVILGFSQPDVHGVGFFVVFNSHHVVSVSSSSLL